MRDFQYPITCVRVWILLNKLCPVIIEDFYSVKILHRAVDYRIYIHCSEIILNLLKKTWTFLINNHRQVYKVTDSTTLIKRHVHVEPYSGNAVSNHQIIYSFSHGRAYWCSINVLPETVFGNKFIKYVNSKINFMSTCLHTVYTRDIN